MCVCTMILMLCMCMRALRDNMRVFVDMVIVSMYMLQYTGGLSNRVDLVLSTSVMCRILMVICLFVILSLNNRNRVACLFMCKTVHSCVLLVM